MAATATTDYLRDPERIARRSFAIVRRETDVAGLPADLAEIAYRMVHASGMTELVADLAWSADFTQAARRALAAGAPVLADCRMVAAGISRHRPPAGNRVICTLAAPGLPIAAAQHQSGQPAHVLIGTLGQNLFVERVALLVAQAGDLQLGATGQLRPGRPAHDSLKLGQGRGRVA